MSVVIQLHSKEYLVSSLSKEGIIDLLWACSQTKDFSVKHSVNEDPNADLPDSSLVTAREWLTNNSTSLNDSQFSRFTLKLSRLFKTYYGVEPRIILRRNYLGRMVNKSRGYCPSKDRAILLEALEYTLSK